MYGYLKYGFGKRTDKISKMYRSYYCGLCNALKKNYGFFAMALLSYDLVFAAIALSSGTSIIREKPVCCLYKPSAFLSEEFSSEYWKRLSVIGIAVLYGKAFDNVLDGKDFSGKFIIKLIKIVFKNAYKSDKELFDFFESSMRGIKEAENKGANITAQCQMTAQMISDAFCKYSGLCVEGETKNFIGYTAKWLCLADALDDYRKDQKHNTYNPLFFFWQEKGECKSKDKIFSEKYIEFAAVYDEVRQGLHSSLKNMPVNGNERLFLEEMIYIRMPAKITHLTNK